MAFYEVSHTELKWFHPYLTNRYQQCLINGFLSGKGKIICGIPQGSILGPLLFLIYINDLPNCLNLTTPCLYADDTQIFASSCDPVELAYNLHSDLENIMDWLTLTLCLSSLCLMLLLTVQCVSYVMHGTGKGLNKLKSHSSKTKFMVIGSKPTLTSKVADLHSRITMNNNSVSPVTSQKCLGVDLDETLAFDIYIEKLCLKICSGIGALRRIKPFVPSCFLIKLYKSLIQPYFDYCSPVWDTCNKTLKDKL